MDAALPAIPLRRPPRDAGQAGVRFGLRKGAKPCHVVADLDLLKLRGEQARIRPDRDITFVDASHQQRSVP